LLKRKELVYIKTNANEEIPAYLIHPSADARLACGRNGRRPLTILYSHGNAEDIALLLDYAVDLAEAAQVSVFCYEYVGYSLSKLNHGASPTESGCKRSVEAAWRYLTTELNIPPNDIVILGRSIGSGPAVHLASRPHIEGTAHSPLNASGVILQSPIESGARAIFGKKTSWVGYYADLFRNYEKVHAITAPVGIMHGTDDEVVPVENGKALHALVQQAVPPLWMQGYGHNDMPDRLVLKYIKDFLNIVGKAPRKVFSHAEK